MAYYVSSREPEFKPDRTPTRVEITARVMANGKPCRPGDVVVLPMCDAAYLEGLKRGRILGALTVEELESSHALQ